MADNKYSRAADKDHAKVSAEKLKVSFEYLDLSLPHFFIHGLVADHYRKIFDCVNEIANATENDILQQTHASLEAKSIFNKGGTYKRFPESVEATIADKLELENRSLLGKDAARQDALLRARKIVERAFEVRVGKAYGRIHGIVWDKVFYVVWFDPAHNLYPTERHGIRMHDAYAEVKGFDPDAVVDLKEAHAAHCEAQDAKYAQLKAEYDELMEQWASI